MSESKRILLVRLSHLGDVVQTLPLFHALRRAFPGAAIGWVTQGEFASLLEGMEGLERVLRFGRREGAGAWLRLREDMVSFGADLVVDAQGNLKSALAALCGAPARRIGPHPADWRERAGSLAMHETAPRAASNGAPPHAMERVLALARLATGLDLAASDLRLDPSLSAGELARGRERLAERIAQREGAPLLLHLAAPGDVRSWPAARYAELARLLLRAGRRPLVLSGPAEEALGAELARQLPDAAHWVGQRGLRELAALLAAAAERGGRLVACDSGPAHLAAACGLPVLLLAGPQSHLRTGPWPLARAPAEVARDAPHAVLTARERPPCAPCLARRCDHPRGPVCMGGIEAAQVLEALAPQVA